MNSVGFIYNPHIPKALVLACHLAQVIENIGWTAWIGSAWDEEGLRERIDTLKVVVTLGGDGTILRAARVAAPAGVPLVGVNLGRLGFLTELMPDSVAETLPQLLTDQNWVEDRAMLSATVVQPIGNLPDGADPADLPAGDCTRNEYLALNDIVLGRGERSRTVQLNLAVDDIYLTTYRADGIVLSTATGSTAYSLSAGGPILHPQMRNLVITPLLAHLKIVPPMVLPEGVHARVQVFTDHAAVLSVDGQVDVPLSNGANVEVRLSEHRALFLRHRNQTYFYETLAQRLRW